MPTRFVKEMTVQKEAIQKKKLNEKIINKLETNYKTPKIRKSEH